MAHLHYLTVQDVLWINLQATKKVQHFKYARLEEATFYQYAYGESASLVSQAGRFLSGFLKLHPFDAGNESTGLIACATFLKINGHEFNVSDDQAIEWLDRVMTKQVAVSDAVAASAKLCQEAHDTLQPPVRSTILAVVQEYPRTIEELKTRSSVAK